MNDNLIRHIMGKILPTVNHTFKNPNSNPILIMIGSILQWADRNTIVWGPGFISAKSGIRRQPKKICAVRGPLSRNRLLKMGFSCPDVYGDPALLYPRFYRPSTKKLYKLGIVAHYIDRHSPLMKNLKAKGVLDIHVKSDVDKIVGQICSCERIASSSLHGLVVADAYGIPSTWIKITNKVLGLGFKFRDYFASVGRTETEPLVISPGVGISDILNSFNPYEIKIDLEKLWECCPVRR